MPGQQLINLEHDQKLIAIMVTDKLQRICKICKPPAGDGFGASSGNTGRDGSSREISFQRIVGPHPPPTKPRRSLHLSLTENGKNAVHSLPPVQILAGGKLCTAFLPFPDGQFCFKWNDRRGLVVRGFELYTFYDAASLALCIDPSISP